jgi:hypothetical protein
VASQHDNQNQAAIAAVHTALMGDRTVYPITESPTVAIPPATGNTRSEIRT